MSLFQCRICGDVRFTIEAALRHTYWHTQEEAGAGPILFKDGAGI